MGFEPVDHSPASAFQYTTQSGLTASACCRVGAVCACLLPFLRVVSVGIALTMDVVNFLSSKLTGHARFGAVYFFLLRRKCRCAGTESSTTLLPLLEGMYTSSVRPALSVSAPSLWEVN